MIDKRTHDLLNHIHSLGDVISEIDSQPHQIARLMQLGYLRKLWIGTYALTEEGQQARREAPAKAG
jgi:hypothetical protein